jgi:hypothetical protein
MPLMGIIISYLIGSSILKVSRHHRIATSFAEALRYYFSLLSSGYPSLPQGRYAGGGLLALGSSPGCGMSCGKLKRTCGV